MSRSRFKPFSSDFEAGGPFFLHLGEDGIVENRILWSSSLISEVPVVSYTSQVEIAVSRYL